MASCEADRQRRYGARGEWEGRGDGEEGEGGYILYVPTSLNFFSILFIHSSAPTSKAGGTFNDLKNYGHKLLASFPNPEPHASDIQVHAEPVVSPFSERSERDIWREREREEDLGVLTGCREAVEILTRNPKKGLSFLALLCVD